MSFRLSVLIDEACRAESELRSVEQQSVESADDGVECRAGGVPRGAIRRLLEFPVKLQSARSTPGSMVGLSNIAAGLLMFTPSRPDSE
jgi:hypothetical protein